MLTYWFKNGDDISVDTIIKVISMRHVGLQDKISDIKAALTSQDLGSSSNKQYATSPPQAHKKPYVEMKASVCRELKNCQCSIDDVLLYLENTDVDPDVVKGISKYSDLFKSLEKHDLMHEAELCWLKAIVQYAKCLKALEIIEDYSDLLIADKTKYSSNSSSKIKNGFVVKYSDKSVEDCTIKDSSEAKEIASNVLGVKDTDGILDSSEVGSLTFFWKVKENLTITFPKFIDTSIIKNCKDAGITQIGIITNGNVELINVTELEVDKSTEYQIERGTEYLQQQYEHTILGEGDQEEWPPYQPNVYTINVLMYNEEKFASKDTLKVYKITNQNKKLENLDSCSDDGRNQFKNVSDIFSRVETKSGSIDHPKTILIEGAPGIGKTMLANQLALQWKSIHLLRDKKFLFLIYLRDPRVHQLHTVEDLLKYMFHDDMLEDNHTFINMYECFIHKTAGSSLALLFDGYDELSKEKRKTSFILKIINREILKESLLIITSRPAGSEELYCYSCRRIEILGFTEQDRSAHLKNTLNDSLRYEKLMRHLQDHPTINSLCYNSLNMMMLVYLFKETGFLPASQPELFDMFISQTVTHFLNKSGFSITFNSLSHFKGRHDSILTELGKLSFVSLSKDKMVFSSLDLQKECPKYFKSQADCSYGLLKEKRHLHMVESSYNFLHLTIQEYLAAWHLSKCNPIKLNSIFRNYFWEHRFFNVWVMYVGITRGHGFSFKHFISGNNFLQTVFHLGRKRLSPQILHDTIKCMYLFQCFKESSDPEMCKKLGKLLQNEIVNLSGHQMSPKNLNTLCFVLTINESCHLKELNLSNCSIGETGCKLFCEDLIKASTSCQLSIMSLNLSSNQLTESSMNLLVKLTHAVRIQNLIICNNQVLDKEAELLCKNCNIDLLCFESDHITE